MSLHGLPDELLEEIASHLDPHSLMAFGMLGRNFRDLSMRFAKNLKLKIISILVLNYLRSNGFVVRSLGLLNSMAQCQILSRLIMDCRNVTDLRVAGTRLSCPEIVELVAELHALDTLSISISPPIYRYTAIPCKRRRVLYMLHDPLSNREFRLLREVHLEVVGDLQSFNFAVDFMNKCTALETVYINTIPGLPGALAGGIELLPERWSTLRTLVVSHFDPSCSGDNQFVEFLTRVFRDKLNQGLVREWIYEKKDCYIYENGNFNGILSKSDGSRGGSTLLEKQQVLRIVSEGPSPPQLWGRPRKLRILGQRGMFDAEMRNILRIPHLWYSTLVELDFTQIHYSGAEKSSHLKLITVAPLLEAIALPPCSVHDINALKRPQENSKDPGRERIEPIFLDRTLRQLRLKKFCLKGTSSCIGCRVTFLTFYNTPALKDLRFLEVLILNQVKLLDSAYSMLGNSRIHTAKLCLGQRSTSTCLREFLERCTSLRNLKLDSCLLPLERQCFWQYLGECKNLKQLCLASRSPTMFRTPRTCLIRLPSNERRAFFANIDRLVERLDIFHLHSAVIIRSETSPTWYLHDYVKDFLLWGCETKVNRGTIDEVFVGPTEDSLVVLSSAGKPPAFAGRALCSSESFIGVIEPDGWTID